MKPLQIIGVIICLLLVLSVAGCTDSKTNTPEKVSTQNTPTAERPIPASTTKETTPIPNSQNKELPAASRNLTVNFLDVGQGDSILVHRFQN